MCKLHTFHYEIALRNAIDTLYEFNILIYEDHERHPSIVFKHILTSYFSDTTHKSTLIQ